MRTKKRNNHLEDDEQAALFLWAAYFPVLKFMLSIPNGAFLHGNQLSRARQMNRLKRQGLRPGALDIFLPLPMPPYAGMWLEMKASNGKGKLSDKQKEFKAAMELNGYKCVVCEGTKAAIEAITKYAKL